ncbi:MAG: metallophosphoesterase [Corynebacterium sp.]|nr:metallophosphoesterase [Corynebacterium sp.]
MKARYGFLAFLASLFAIPAYGYVETKMYQLKTVELPILPKGTLKDKKDFRILHISDLHMTPAQTDKKEWVRSLAALNPDLVINTGDNLSDLQAVPTVIQSLDPLLSIPGAFVFGSNDYWAPRPVNPFGYLLGKKRKVSRIELPWRGMRAAFIERGWHDANNKRVEFQVGDVRLAISGVDDPHHNLDDYPAIAGAPNPNADLSIALTHSPEPFILEQFEKDGYMLSLSGHTHGGQICLPGGRAIVTNCGIDRPRAQGLHRFGRMWMYVSNGMGTSKYAPVRFFCRPSVTLLVLKEEN